MVSHAVGASAPSKSGAPEREAVSALRWYGHRSEVFRISVLEPDISRDAGVLIFPGASEKLFAAEAGVQYLI